MHHSHNFYTILQGIAGATDVSNFLRAFLMVSLNSLSSGSIKWIPRNSRAFSRWSFSWDHFCFPFSLACLPIDFQNSGHKWSGLDVSCFLVSLSPDQVYPSRAFSSNRVNCVNPVQGSDKSRDPSIFQYSSMRFLLDIQIRMSNSGYVNVLQWNREWFFCRRVKFDSWFNVMAVYETSRYGPKIF